MLNISLLTDRYRYFFYLYLDKFVVTKNILFVEQSYLCLCDHNTTFMKKQIRLSICWSYHLNMMNSAKHMKIITC